MDTSDIITSVAAPMGSAGASFYFAPATLARGKELGLDGFRFYFLGRGSVMGDVSASMVHGAFGYFARPLVDKIWTSAKERVSTADAAAAYLSCCADYGRAALGDVEGLDAYCAAATKVIDAADPSSLPLFAGAAAAPRPDDVAALALHQTAVLRELRGSVHLLAVVASGLDPAVAHAIRRPDDVANFGHDPAPEITDTHRAALAAADALTDRLLERPYGVADGEQGQALVDGAARIAAAVAAS